MKYLQRAYDLARQRGYLTAPETAAVVPSIPDWFRNLGTPAGVADYESRTGIYIPLALCEFYASLPLACFFRAAVDGDVFLNAIQRPEPPPPLITYQENRYLVFSYHTCSGCIFAAEVRPSMGRGASEVNVDDPRVFLGDELDPALFDDRGLLFSEWIYRWVDKHEEKLDQAMTTYEFCRKNPQKALSVLQNLRRLPGGPPRIEKLKL